MSNDMNTIQDRHHKWKVNTTFCGWVVYTVREYGAPINQSAILDALRISNSDVTEGQLRDTLNVLVVLGILKHEWDGETVLYSCTNKESIDGDLRRGDSGEQVEAQP